MNRFVARTLIRSIIDGGNHCRLEISTAAMENPLKIVELVRTYQKVGGPGGFYWTRTMSSVTPGPMTSSVAEKEEKVEKKGEEWKTSDQTTVVSSYWGMSRQKIKRADGTDWPWNCFMVTQCFRRYSPLNLSVILLVTS